MADKQFKVAVQYKGSDGVREVQFLTETIVLAPDALQAIGLVLSQVQADRASPGSLSVLAREL